MTSVAPGRGGVWVDGVLRFTSAYTIHFEEGNFFDQVGKPVEGDRLVASAGIFVRLRPLTVAEHTIASATTYTSGDVLEATVHLTVSA